MVNAADKEGRTPLYWAAYQLPLPDVGTGAVSQFIVPSLFLLQKGDLYPNFQLTSQAHRMKTATASFSRGVSICCPIILACIPLLAGCAPRLDSADPSQRRAALEKVTDQTILIKFALTDVEPDVRADVVERVTDQAVLGKIVLEDTSNEVTSAAFPHVTDQKVLLQIALHGQDEVIRRQAFEKLTDQAVLTELALNTDNVAIVQKLTDHADLLKIAQESNSDEQAMAAFAKLTNLDQATLTELAIKGMSEQIHAAAIAQISDQAMLTHIALDANSMTDQISAIRKITDQSVLTQILNQEAKSQHQDESGKDVQLAAIEGLTDQTQLTNFALANQAELSRAAFLKLTDPASLQKIVDATANLDFKKVATLALQGQAMLAQIIEADDGTLSTYQCKLAYGMLTDPDLLVKLADGAKDDDLKLATQIRLKKTTVDAAIADVVTGTRQSLVVMGAIYWLADQDSLDDPSSVNRDELDLCDKCIAKSNPAYISNLLQILNQYGNKALAEMYANSGQKDLVAAANSWATKNGFTITDEIHTGSPFFSGRAHWNNGP